MLNETDLSRVDLNLLVLFEAVLGEGHVGRAAERLNLSPSAVSHGLGRLRRLLNDPLFLKIPKGVVPTARATELAESIADLLARARNVLSTAKPFEAATSTRRFAIGAPDGVTAVILPPLLAEIRCMAPDIDVSVRQVHRDTALADLDSRTVDIVIVPLDDIPARFAERTLYEEDFVIATRAGHPFADAPSLDRYCRMLHLIVSLTGEPRGHVGTYVDQTLARQGLSRRVALTVPNFMLALAIIGETDLIAALPRTLMAMHAARFGVTGIEAPLPLRRFQMRAIAPKVAMMDAGLAWLFDLLSGVAQAAITARGRSWEA
jgi:DNA-binding transcriptional LysR family regulator